MPGGSLRLLLGLGVFLALGDPAPLIAQADARPRLQAEALLVRTCPLADKLLGRGFQRQDLYINGFYHAELDETFLFTVPRSSAPDENGVAGLWGEVAFAGALAPGVPDIRLLVRLVEPVERPIADRLVSLWIGDSLYLDQRTVRWTVEPGYRGKGVAQRVRLPLTPEQFTALARAERVRLRMGATDVTLYSFELRDLNGLYRAAVCGTKLEKYGRVSGRN